jgi:hypothetical protein
MKKTITLDEIKFLISYQRNIFENCPDDKDEHAKMCYLVGIENALAGITYKDVEENTYKIKSM